MGRDTKLTELGKILIRVLVSPAHTFVSINQAW